MSSVIIQEIKYIQGIKYKINKPSSFILKRDINEIKNKHFKIIDNICQKAEMGGKNKSIASNTHQL